MGQPFEILEKKKKNPPEVRRHGGLGWREVRVQGGSGVELLEGFEDEGMGALREKRSELAVITVGEPPPILF